MATVRDEVIAVLRDPMSLPDELKSWLIKYVEANPPSLPIRGMSGYIQPTKVTMSSFSDGPPSDAKDGDVWIGFGVDSAGTRWQFQYNASSASDHKWEFIGGAPTTLNSTVAPSSWTLSAFDTFDATAWTASVAGDYMAWGEWSGTSPVGGGTFAEQAGVSYDDGTGFADPTLVSQTSNPSAGTSPFNVSAPPVVVEMKATNEVALGYWTNGTPFAMFSCSLTAIPVRVG